MKRTVGAALLALLITTGGTDVRPHAASAATIQDPQALQAVSTTRDQDAKPTRHRLGPTGQRPAALHADPVALWAASAQATALRQCESSGHYDDSTGNGYYGAYQADASFWVTYGGDPRYLGTRPFAAPVQMQDAVAYRGFLARGWEPWQCAWPGHLGYYNPR